MVKGNRSAAKRQPDFRKGYQYPTGDEVVNVSRVIKITSCFGWKRGNAFASLLYPVSVKSIINGPDVFTGFFQQACFLCAVSINCSTKLVILMSSMVSFSKA